MGATKKKTGLMRTNFKHIPVCLCEANLNDQKFLALNYKKMKRNEFYLLTSNHKKLLLSFNKCDEDDNDDGDESNAEFEQVW